uniref:Uncharacterized protein n=1 Tax=Mycena chlorophos TaxID=658473 RepID=A0ABQ0LFB3_MYCCL|nr:predicted protein [Mycena chlorophos]
MTSSPPYRAAKRDKLSEVFEHSPTSLLDAYNTNSPEAIKFRETYQSNILAFASAVRAREDSIDESPNPRPRKQQAGRGLDIGRNQSGEPAAQQDENNQRGPSTRSKSGPTDSTPAGGGSDDDETEHLQDVERKAISPKDFLELVESDFGISTARDKAAKEDAGLVWLASGFTRFDLNSKAEIQRQWMEKIKGELSLEQTVKTLVAAIPVCPAPETANNSQDKSAKEADIVDFLIDSNLARELQQSTAKGTGLALHALQSTTDIRYSIAWEAQTQAKRFGDWKKPRFAQAMAAKRLTELLMMFGPGVLLDKRFTIQSLASTSPKYGTVVPAFYRALDKDSKTDEEVYTDYCVDRSAVVGIAEALDPALSEHIQTFLNEVICNDLKRARKAGLKTSVMQWSHRHSGPPPTPAMNLRDRLQARRGLKENTDTPSVSFGVSHHISICQTLDPDAELSADELDVVGEGEMDEDETSANKSSGETLQYSTFSDRELGVDSEDELLTMHRSYTPAGEPLGPKGGLHDDHGRGQQEDELSRNGTPNSNTSATNEAIDVPMDKFKRLGKKRAIASESEGSEDGDEYDEGPARSKVKQQALTSGPSNNPAHRRPKPAAAKHTKPSHRGKYTVANNGLQTGVSQLLDRVSTGRSTSYSPYGKFSKQNISKIPPLHPNRRTPLPAAPLSAPPMISKCKPKTEKEEEEEEEWEDSLIRDVGGWETWKCLDEEKQNAARSAKRRREQGLDE